MMPVFGKSLAVAVSKELDDVADAAVGYDEVSSEEMEETAVFADESNPEVTSTLSIANAVVFILAVSCVVTSTSEMVIISVSPGTALEVEVSGVVSMVPAVKSG